MRALVVEDEASLREGLREQLAKQGFTVDVAADGEEGLFAGKEYPLDIAIVDLGLPKLPGLDLIRALRKAEAQFRARVVRTEVQDEDGRKVYVLKLLSDDGRVITVRIDAATGRMR